MSDWEDDEPMVLPQKKMSGFKKRNGEPRGRQEKSSYSHKRYDNEKLFRMIQIKDSSIGRVIGRGGATIQSIQRDFDVEIKVDKVSATVQVFGMDDVSVDSAIRHIRELDRGEKSGHFGNKNSRKSSTEAKSPVEIKPFIPIDWDNVYKQSAIKAAARWAKCPKLTKDFYEEAPEVSTMTQAEVNKILSSNNNTSVSFAFEPKSGEKQHIPNPVWSFEHCFAKYPDLLTEVKKQGFASPSPIQAQAWPILLSGQDLIGIAQTGTGKTLAFLLPAMIHTEYQHIPRGRRGGANVLILAPTRELALQIETEVNKYNFRGMKAVCVYGGGDRKYQISEIERGAEIMICTPGRLNDLIEAKVIDISSVTFLILDEADRMLDMGFEIQIRKVLLDIRPDRQTVMTSATWPAGVRRLAQSYMNNPIQVCVGSLDLAATHSVEQIIHILADETEKYPYIKQFLKSMEERDKAIVFCGKKARADDLSSDLTLDGFMTQCIHGNRDQKDREQAINDIKTGYVKILVATDVASRGLDIEDITYVINYDFPHNIEEYVHRVGRTGRAGKKGKAISLITRSDWSMAKELISILEEAKQIVPDELRAMARRFQGMKERKSIDIHSTAASRTGYTAFDGNSFEGEMPRRRRLPYTPRSDIDPVRQFGYGGGVGYSSYRGGGGRSYKDQYTGGCPPNGRGRRNYH